MHCHVEMTANAVRQAIGCYLKMAPYRRGGAGKGATLHGVADDGSSVHSEPDETEMDC